MTTNGKRHKKGAKGKLISKHFELCQPNKRICTTCQYHDIDSLTPATSVRTDQYEFMTINVYFCDKHASEQK